MNRFDSRSGGVSPWQDQLPVVLQIETANGLGTNGIGTLGKNFSF